MKVKLSVKVKLFVSLLCVSAILPAKAIPKWLILCRVGHISHTHSLTPACRHFSWKYDQNLFDLNLVFWQEVCMRYHPSLCTVIGIIVPPRCLHSVAVCTKNAGFLQVRENWKMSGNLCCQGNVKEKYFFWKVRENDLGSCRLRITVIFLHLQILKSRQICGFHWMSKS